MMKVCLQREKSSKKKVELSEKYVVDITFEMKLLWHLNLLWFEKLLSIAVKSALFLLKHEKWLG